jgi:uncharacterized protein YkwD
MAFLSKPVVKYAMQYLLALLFLTISLFLAACGGGSGGAAANPDGNPDGNVTPQVTAGASRSSAPAPAVIDNDNTCSIPNFQVEMTALINAARAKGAVCGEVTFKPSKPLVWNDLLSAAAVIHSKDMAQNDFFAHDSPTTGSLRERIHSTGFQYEVAGENLAGGQTNIAKVVNDWLQSPSHCVNLLNPFFKVMGAACKRNVAAYYKNYWTLEMALPLGEKP